jgi:NitT/TauT family transport system substrate-binding protein
MKPTLAFVIPVALVALAAGGLAWWVVAPPAAPAGPPVEVTVGKMAIPAHALLYLARDRGYFAENGLAVTFREYGTGPEAMDALLDGEVAIAASGEFVVVQQAFDRAPVRVVASIDRYEFFSLAARQDRGIVNASDLAGKRIGVGRRSNGDFFLGRFLDLNGIGLDTVTLVDVPPPQWADAVANGSVDAIVIRRPAEVAPVRERFGDGVVVWPVQNDQPSYLVMSCRNDWIADHQETLRRLLTSLARAEEYALADPDEAKAIVGQRASLSRAYLDEIWPQHRFALSLDRSLLYALNDEAQWAVANNLTSATNVPDFREYMDTTALARVDPNAVTIL